MQKILLGALLAALCGGYADADDGKDSRHEARGFAIHINQAGELERVVSETGEEFVQCQLCGAELAEKYGETCKDAPAEARICKGLTNATVNDIDSIFVFTSHRNPDCILIKRSGSGSKVLWAWPPGCAH